MQKRLDSLGMNKAKVARYYGVSRQTIYQWIKGGCPAHVAAHMDYLIACKVSLDAVKDA